MFSKNFQTAFTSLVISASIFSCTGIKSGNNQTTNQEQSPFYSSAGVEQQVRFKAVARTTEFTLAEVATLDAYTKSSFEKYTVKQAIQFLFGPLTHRELGGMRTDSKVTVDWNSARAAGDAVELDYTYNGAWLIANKALNDKSIFTLPLPYDVSLLKTEGWLNCTDSEPEHQTDGFYWYFWDPTRWGCDHTEGKEYQMINIQLGERTVNQKQTYPKYSEILKSNGQENNLQMTFAFGYVSDVEDANPDKDDDYGMQEYRKFVRHMDKQAKKLNLTKTVITQAEYADAAYPDKAIGYRYTGMKNGVKIEAKVVTAANIDQMELFAKSYAHDHDGFFAWFGHSRVGSGFDANNFKSMVDYNSEFYSISAQYQLVYWAGCNSYSYYTLPFFQHKAKLNANDPKGTLGLDILSNGLPSLFSFNAYNAILTYNALINWETPTSYQSIIQDLEKYGRQSGVTVLVNVIGDEDNQ